MILLLCSISNAVWCSCCCLCKCCLFKTD